MKFQDILFLFAILFAAWRGKSRISVLAGIACILIAMSLFKLWVFFTAERLTWYAAAFFLLAIVQFFWRIKDADRN